MRHHGRQSSDPLRATLEDLPLLGRDGRADAEAMAQTLVQRLKWQARQDDRDPLRQLAPECKAQPRRPSREPAFFAFLWLTCLIAVGYPDANAEGRFWDRFSRVFPQADTAYRFCIDQAWELLSNWLEDGQTFQGLPFSQLELPPVDTWQPHITHSRNLAFPPCEIASSSSEPWRPCEARSRPSRPPIPHCWSDSCASSSSPLRSRNG